MQKLFSDCSSTNRKPEKHVGMVKILRDSAAAQVPLSPVSHHVFTQNASLRSSEISDAWTSAHPFQSLTLWSSVNLEP